MRVCVFVFVFVFELLSSNKQQKPRCDFSLLKLHLGSHCVS